MRADRVADARARIYGAQLRTRLNRFEDSAGTDESLPLLLTDLHDLANRMTGGEPRPRLRLITPRDFDDLINEHPGNGGGA